MIEDRGRVRNPETDRRVTHGLTRGSKGPPEFNVWCKMLSRCENKNNKDFPNYGGRGISVCDSWREFQNFYADMGRRPGPDYSIDRIDNDGIYEPGNCRWTTKVIQNNNQRQRRLRDDCRKGHPLSGNNLYLTPGGKRQCRICRSRNMRDFYIKNRRAA